MYRAIQASLVRARTSSMRCASFASSVPWLLRFVSSACLHATTSSIRSLVSSGVSLPAPSMDRSISDGSTASAGSSSSTCRRMTCGSIPRAARSETIRRRRLGEQREEQVPPLDQHVLSGVGLIPRAITNEARVRREPIRSSRKGPTLADDPTPQKGQREVIGPHLVTKRPPSLLPRQLERLGRKWTKAIKHRDKASSGSVPSLLHGWLNLSS